MKKKIDWNHIADSMESGNEGEMDRQILEDSQQIWQKTRILGEKLQKTEVQVDLEAAKAKMRARILDLEESETPEDSSKRVPMYRTGLFRYAAAAAVLVMLGYVVLKSTVNNNTTSQEIAVNTTEQPKDIQLVDGSTVTLANGATLSYPANFEGNTRVVSLKGAAFFDIARDEQKPFVISTALAKVKVLGTSFDLDAQADHVTLNVKTGKVAFSNEATDKSFFVVANQHASYDAKEDKLVKYIDDKNSIIWDNQQIRLKGVSLHEVSQILEHRDNVKFSFDAAARMKAEEKVSGVIKLTEDVTDALSKFFKLENKYKFEKKGRDIHVSYVQ